jgi:hypothetical protein
VRVLGNRELASSGRAQDVTVPGRHREPTFRIQTERRSTLKHDNKPFFMKSVGERRFKGINYHLIPLFCTVSAKAWLASRLTTKISNEIKDLASKLQVAAS